MALTKIRKALDFTMSENTAQRVLRIAEQKNPEIGRHRALHRIPIKAPTQIGHDMINSDQSRTRILMHTDEGRIHRRAGHHSPLLAKGFHCQ